MKITPHSRDRAEVVREALRREVRREIEAGHELRDGHWHPPGGIAKSFTKGTAGLLETLAYAGIVALGGVALFALIDLII